MNDKIGTLTWISGSVVRAQLEGRLAMAEQVWVGQKQLAAEVIALNPEQAIIQVYEDTAGLHVGEPLYGTRQPMSVSLGPGLLGQTFDGIQRPLDLLHQRSGVFIRHGERAAALDDSRTWTFSPRAEPGDQVGPGDILGVVSETSLIEHRILVPPGVRGKLDDLASEDDYTVKDEIAVVVDDQSQDHRLGLSQSWPVRRPRPAQKRLQPAIPLITGQRVLDTFFPLSKGGAAAIPGPFGSGKTVLQQSLAKWSDADIIIYVGCGERGNEMAEVLEDFPELKDPWSNRPLMERTVLIANTSNMPVAAREASIYTGVTIAEYYRDQGYDVALMADSTSRWAEALREISGRLEEMPAEEGYPAYLSSRLAAFYERAGRVKTLGGREGSVSIIGAVSPPGGDFSEPVTRNTQRFIQTWWALDRQLANRRHYPAVGWLNSYSLFLEQVAAWWEEQVELDWHDLRHRAMVILEAESGLQELVRLVGPEALAEEQQWTLNTARLLREGFLQQNALHEIDAYAVPEKQIQLLDLFMDIHRLGQDLLNQGISIEQLQDVLDMAHLIRLKEEVSEDELDKLAQVHDDIKQEFQELQEQDS